MELNIITIDGPAGSGKSTVAKLVAKKLGWKYLDTGVMYRGLTYALLKSAETDNSILDDDFILQKVKKLNWEIKIENQSDKNELRTVFLLDNQELADADIRSKKVESEINKVSNKIEIRKMFYEIQRKFGLEGELVTEGRDQGSTIFPDAKYKFYLDASLKIRAERRIKDYNKRGEEITLEKLLTEIERRDINDKNRSYGALKVPENAIIIDTSELNIQQVVKKIISHIN